MTEQIPAQQDDEQLEGMSRERLYELVWSVAASALAKWYGVSDNGLAKICHRMDVPRPPRGWWTKKEMGKEPPVPDLPPRGSDVPATIRRGRAPVEVTKTVGPEIKKPSPVPDRIRNPHPIVAGWWTKNLGQDGRRLEKLSELEKRHHRICDALFKMLEAQGGKVRAAPGRFVFEMDGADIEFYIRESRPGLRKQYAANPRGTELLGEIQLVFVVMTHISGLRELWPEGKRRQLEEIVPEFSAALIDAIPVQVQQVRKREAERHAWELKQRQIAEDERRIRRDRQQWQNFLQLAKRQQEAELARSFLSDLQKIAHDRNKIVAGRSLADWVAWVSRKADEKDPLQWELEAIFSAVAN